MTDTFYDVRPIDAEVPDCITGLWTHTRHASADSALYCYVMQYQQQSNTPPTAAWLRRWCVDYREWSVVRVHHWKARRSELLPTGVPKEIEGIFRDLATSIGASRARLRSEDMPAVFNFPTLMPSHLRKLLLEYLQTAIADFGPREWNRSSSFVVSSLGDWLSFPSIARYFVVDTSPRDNGIER